ncbi:MAG: hypothetical protein K0R08_1907 [Solimicrobium sp.]|jgi:hypothetical protein|nr:hypothetical protein [Solimicrobium sp.]
MRNNARTKGERQMEGIINRDNYLAATQRNSLIPVSDSNIKQEVKDLLKDGYDSNLSAAQNVIVAIQTGKFPTAYEVTLKELSFSLENQDSRIIIPENVTLENCEVIRGQVYFSAGELSATDKEASAFANGNSAVADAMVAGANAAAKVTGAKATAMARGAVANAAAKGAEAMAMTSGAIANATDSGAKVYAMTSGAVANATASRSKAYAMTSDSVANATAAGAKAIAMVSDAVANATVPGSVTKTYRANSDTYQGRQNVRANLRCTKEAMPENY